MPPKGSKKVSPARKQVSPPASRTSRKRKPEEEEKEEEQEEKEEEQPPPPKPRKGGDPTKSRVLTCRFWVDSAFKELEYHNAEGEMAQGWCKNCRSKRVCERKKKPLELLSETLWVEFLTEFGIPFKSMSQRLQEKRQRFGGARRGVTTGKGTKKERANHQDPPPPPQAQAAAAPRPLNEANERAALKYHELPPATYGPPAGPPSPLWMWKRTVKEN